MNVEATSSRTICRWRARPGRSAGTGAAIVGTSVRSMLRHHAWALSRTDSSTSASGWAAASSRQNAVDGQSTNALKPAGKVLQSGISPRTAAHQTSTSCGRSDTTIMW